MVLLGLLRVLLDLIPGDSPADRPQRGGDILASAAADLVADDPADHGAADRADARSLARFFNFAHVLDHTALTADCNHDRRGRRTTAWATGRCGSAIGLGFACLTIGGSAGSGWTFAGSGACAIGAAPEPLPTEVGIQPSTAPIPTRENRLTASPL